MVAIRSEWAHALSCAAVFATIAASAAAAPAPAAPPPTAAAAATETVVEPIYDSGLQSKWADLGWAPRDTDTGKPARVNFAANGGWTLRRSGLTGPFTSLVFRLAAPARFGDFLEVHVAAEGSDTFPRVAVTAAQTKPLGHGWVEVRLPLAQLNPKRLPFDRITLHAARAVDSLWVELDQMALTGPALAGGVARAFATHRASVQIDCTRPARAISPLIYGVAYNPRRNEPYQWRLGATVRRWGGNPASRYNQRLGNAWNTGSDWYFMNVNYSAQPNFTWEAFFNENRDHGVQAALTVPTIGWVARDAQSYSYPVSVYGAQKSAAGPNNDAGNGVRVTGGQIEGADPRRTSIPAPPEFIAEWVEAITNYDEDKHTRSVNMYILDNEPSLWNSTHRDVHPGPLTYDELLERMITYGSQIRRTDSTAVIAGPADWGWPPFFFSARDAEAGFSAKPDRRAHGDVPLLAWLLQQLRAYEERTGERVLNVLDMHYYPQGDGIYGVHERTDPLTSERRIRATRSLWDPTYRDESWINDRVRLIPRMRQIIAENYPALEVSIGEYNFGGERTMSGGLALAEALGRFGQEGVYSAFYWTYPPDGSAAYHAFRAYRDYDGVGGRFLDHSVPTTGDRGVSLFASRDEAGGKFVTIALNLDAREVADMTVDLVGCGDIKAGKSYQYSGAAEGLTPLAERLTTEGRSTFKEKLPPYSITVFEMDVDRGRGF